MQSQLETSLRTVIEYLDTQGYRYAIIGGLALSHWGVVRATYDVDLKILVPDNDYQTIRTKLLEAFPDVARPELPVNSLIVAVSVNDVTVDFLLAIPGYEELMIQRAVSSDMGGWSAWFATAEDLIIQKAIANRDKDWLDIEALLREQFDNLDTAYIDEWLVQFAEVLDNPTLIEKYQNVFRRVESM